MVFIGSMNLDARSARDGLRLAADGEHIEWIETNADGKQIIHTQEPDDSFLLRLKQWLVSPFVSDALL